MGQLILVLESKSPGEHLSIIHQFNLMPWRRMVKPLCKAERDEMMKRFEETRVLYERAGWWISPQRLVLLYAQGWQLLTISQALGSTCVFWIRMGLRRIMDEIRFDILTNGTPNKWQVWMIEDTPCFDLLTLPRSLKSKVLAIFWGKVSCGGITEERNLSKLNFSMRPSQINPEAN